MAWASEVPMANMSGTVTTAFKLALESLSLTLILRGRDFATLQYVGGVVGITGR
jgi:hypothetical protein